MHSNDHFPATSSIPGCRAPLLCHGQQLLACVLESRPVFHAGATHLPPYCPIMPAHPVFPALPCPNALQEEFQSVIATGEGTRGFSWEPRAPQEVGFIAQK